MPHEPRTRLPERGSASRKALPCRPPPLCGGGAWRKAADAGTFDSSQNPAAGIRPEILLKSGVARAAIRLWRRRASRRAGKSLRDSRRAADAVGRDPARPERRRRAGLPGGQGGPRARPRRPEAPDRLEPPRRPSAPAPVSLNAGRRPAQWPPRKHARLLPQARMPEGRLEPPDSPRDSPALPSRPGSSPALRRFPRDQDGFESAGCLDSFRKP